MELAPVEKSKSDRSLRESAPSPIEEPAPSQSGAESVALAAGGIAALLAGACCVGPFVLLSLGLGGAWLANFQWLEPYRAVFIGIALAALGLSAWRVYRSTVDCSPGEICAAPHGRHRFRIGFWIVATLLLAMLGFPYVAPLLF